MVQNASKFQSDGQNALIAESTRILPRCLFLDVDKGTEKNTLQFSVPSHNRSTVDPQEAEKLSTPSSLALDNKLGTMARAFEMLVLEFPWPGMAASVKKFLLITLQDATVLPSVWKT